MFKFESMFKLVASRCLNLRVDVSNLESRVSKLGVDVST